MGASADYRPNDRSKSTQEREIEFPQYLMVIDGNMEFMTLQRAGVMLDSGWQQVRIQGFVLEADLKVRNITSEEEQKLQDIADNYSASK